MKRTTVSESALVLAPWGRDAAVAQAILQEAGFEAKICSSLSGLLSELDQGAAFVVMTEDAIATADLQPLSLWLSGQEEWSDLPFILLTARGGGLERNSPAERLLKVLGNVTFLERPFHPTTLVSLARACLRARHRQYDARARLVALREGEEKYRTLFESIDAGFCVAEVDLNAAGGRIDYRVVEANPAFFDQTGFSAEILGRWLREAAPGLEEHWYETYGRIVATGESARFEERADALGRWFDVHAFRTGEVGAHRVAILFNDITARRRTEEQLQQLNDTLEQQVAERSAERDRLWNLSQDMLARADFSGMMSAVSPAWTQVLGWSEQELLSRGYATFMHPDDAGPTLAAITQMSETHEPTRFENRIATSDGGWKHIEWTVAPEADGANFIAVGRDLSHAKAREAELDLAQDALRQSQKMEAMGQLTGGVAHDFNNLLTPIIGSLDRLQRKGLGDDRDRRLIDGAMQSAERARTLVQRLLAFARRQPLQMTAVDVRLLIEGLADLLRSTIGPRIALALNIPEGLPAATADENQIEMAILNLAVNSRDAMRDGGTLSINAQLTTADSDVQPDLPAGDYIRITVADTGDGMDEATLARAVEPFFSTKGIGQGTGLGLSMVHGVAAQMGGALTISSEIGRGTRIDFYLPVSDEVATTHLAPAAPEAPQESATILLVDDELLIRMSTAEMLTDLGYGVIDAGSAEEALRLVSDGKDYDILVTDHLMPGLSGVELANELRKSKPRLPVLIVSGYADIDGIDASIPRLVKPFRLAELVTKLDELMVAVAA